MIMGHSKHKLSRKNMLYSLKKFSYDTPSLPHNSSHLSTMAAFFCPKVAIVERFNSTLNFLENHADRHQNFGNASGLSYIKTFLPDPKG